MGIAGLLPALGPAPRTSLAALSLTHYTTHSRPLRLAIDISIWLFQIQLARGGSNPALRTFYYRLLRLLSLNIHPLFVFDGPHKPALKRNKKVGGRGEKVATVPEFLAKQLLKQFGFPWHVAPGEAEAECALLQTRGVVDGVVSEDVDTLMFGSTLTLRNWTAEGGMGKGKGPPTHVSVFRAEETFARSGGVDRAGMILVALMSGGDYLPDGIPGCGIKVAIAAARAGFGASLLALAASDTVGLEAWKSDLASEIRTNTSNFFSRKMPSFEMPDDFPNREVLGYYTHPCVSTPDKIARLAATITWDAPVDFPALHDFAKDAFDWRCVGGAKKFIRNLAPAILVKRLRLRGESNTEAESEGEGSLVAKIHSQRTHTSVDGELEYRVAFTPCDLVPIDLSVEDDDDEFTSAGGADDDESDAPSSTADGDASPTRKVRKASQYDPSVAEKLWVLRGFLMLGCPGLVEEYEAGIRESGKVKVKAKAGAKVRKGGAREKKKKDGLGGMEGGEMRVFTQVRKVGVERRGSGKENENESEAVLEEVDLTVEEVIGVQRAVEAEKEIGGRRVATAKTKAATTKPRKKPLAPPTTASQPSARATALDDADLSTIAAFRLPATQIPTGLFAQYLPSQTQPALADDDDGHCDAIDFTTASPTPRPFARFAKPLPPNEDEDEALDLTQVERTTRPFARFARILPEKEAQRRKRRTPDFASPVASQRSIRDFYSPSPAKTREREVVNLISSSPAPVVVPAERESEGDRETTPTPTPPNIRHNFLRSPSPTIHPSTSLDAEMCLRLDGLHAFSPGKLPDTVTKRRKKGPLRRYRTAPVSHIDDFDDVCALDSSAAGEGGGGFCLDDATVAGTVEAMDLASPSLCFHRTEEVMEEEEAFVGSWEDAEEEEELPSPSALFGRGERVLLPTPPLEAPVFAPRSIALKALVVPVRAVLPVAEAKKRIQLRASLRGAWKEVDADLDVAAGGGEGMGWRKSGVEVLDLTGS